ncbi:protein jag [Tumebacillus algifaecis]|uniref:RNA-binding protein KhpB n=1 Tax=Tumebacillus algifaecis TaxID=1214604 RepID=A0A223CWH1_9BACL|nr:RNA-binding cell elongation regulator Jag/EloR [Tumebacillus algifaecis]ASS73555.1 protein jag [Tumebacillus algifaecis]
MKKLITTGKTVELATELALKKLGVSRDRVTVTVLTQPSRGFFGLFGTRDAEVEVELLQLDPMEETIKFLRDVLESMSIKQVGIDVEQESDTQYLIKLSGESIGILIGRRGTTLDAMQYLVNLVANKHSERFLKIVLDAEEYRLRRKETLERLAERLANKALMQKREIMLEPMSPTERKVIHSYLQHREDVVTFSHGDEPHRKVVISPKGKKGEHARERGSRRTSSKHRS